MEDKIYKEYLVWLKETHDITPDDKYMGVNVLQELKTMRDEFTGLLGETQIVKMMKEDGTFEKNKKHYETKYSILTFEEYKNSKQIKMTESKIALFNDKGFHMTFENGMTISVRFSESSYSHRIETTKPNLLESFNAEIAIWNKEGEWFNFGYDEVKGYCSPQEIADWIYIAKNSSNFEEISQSANNMNLYNT